VIMQAGVTCPAGSAAAPAYSTAERCNYWLLLLVVSQWSGVVWSGRVNNSASSNAAVVSRNCCVTEAECGRAAVTGVKVK